MYYGAYELLHNTIKYSVYVIKHKECKWYEFKKKKAYKDLIDWHYPLMLGEITTYHKINET